MKYFIFSIACLLISFQAQSGSPWFYGLGKAVNLENVIEYKNNVKNITGSLNPSVVAVNAAAGSLYLSTNGNLYVKQDAGSSTNWFPLAADSNLVHITGTETITGLKTFQNASGVTIAAQAGAASPLSNTNLHVSGLDGNTNRILIDSYGGNPALTQRKANGTQSAPTALLALDNIGFLNYYGHDGTAYSSTANATILALATSNWAVGDHSTEFRFQLTPIGSTTQATVMTLKGSGNVGIGTTSPLTKFHLLGTNTTAMARIESTSSSTTGYTKDSPGLGLVSAGTDTVNKYTPLIKFMTTDTAFTTENPKMSAAIFGRATESYAADTDGGMAIDFATSPDNVGATSVPTVRMSINQNGNVGIGAESPGATLDVRKNLTGATSTHGIRSLNEIQSDVTSAAAMYRSQPSTAAASFTLTDLFHYVANQTSIGAGSTVTNQYGFYASSTAVGATNDYGFYSDLASGSGNWNFYANGAAANYFAGQTMIGTNSANATARFTIASQSGISSPATNTTAQISGSDGVSARLDLTSYGATPIFDMRKANGTQASQTALASGDTIAAINHVGYDGSAYYSSVSVVSAATETFVASTNGGGEIRFQTTPNGTQTKATKAGYSNDGVPFVVQLAPVSKAAAATLTAAEVRNVLLQYTGTGDNLQMPTGTDLTTAMVPVTNGAFDFYLINTGSGSAVLTTNTGVTFVGSATVTAGASGSFRARRSAANTFIVYRLN